GAKRSDPTWCCRRGEAYFATRLISFQLLNGRCKTRPVASSAIGTSLICAKVVPRWRGGATFASLKKAQGPGPAEQVLRRPRPLLVPSGRPSGLFLLWLHLGLELLQRRLEGLHGALLRFRAGGRAQRLQRVLELLQRVCGALGGRLPR